MDYQAYKDIHGTGFIRDTHENIREAFECSGLKNIVRHFDQILGQERVKNQACAAAKPPHLVVSGPPGTGKSAAVGFPCVNYTEIPGRIM